MAWPPMTFDPLCWEEVDERFNQLCSPTRLKNLRTERPSTLAFQSSCHASFSGLFTVFRALSCFSLLFWCDFAKSLC